MPDFTFDTVYETGLALKDIAVKAKKTAIIFLRYYGCTLCQYDIHVLAQNYDKLTANGGQIFIVLQSNPVKLAEKLPKGSLPFEIICDPDQVLYKKFEIQPAASMVKLGDGKTMLKIGKATKAGFKHGDYEGEELQLPAVFVIDESGILNYVHYGKSAGDIPDISELELLLK
jgi:Peroxiredoxin